MGIKRKNYSFYMPDDFVDKITTVQAANDNLKALSRSQALYAIISDMATKVKSCDADTINEDSNF